MKNKVKEKRYKLDNAATIYPSVMTKTWSAMFRLSANLKENIDQDILYAAINDTLNRLPSFKSKLKKGFFWFYFTENTKDIVICKETNKPLLKYSFKKNNDYLFKIKVKDNLLAIEFFHSITDGFGGMTFLLTIIKQYIYLKYNEDVGVNEYVLSLNDQSLEEEFEDAYIKYYRKPKKIEKEEICYYPKGLKMLPFDISIVTGIVSTSSLYDLAKSYDTTIGILLTSVLLFSYMRNQKSCKSKNERTKPIKIAIPINLRKYYQTKTLRNFTYITTPTLYPKVDEYKLTEIIAIVKEYMKENLKEIEVNKGFSRNVVLEINPFIKIIPLFIKNPIMRMIYLNRNKKFSTTFSNLGRIDLPIDMEKYVERLDFKLGQASIAKSIGAVLSYKNNTIISFSRTIIDASIEKAFFETLIDLGIDVMLEINEDHLISPFAKKGNSFIA